MIKIFQEFYDIIEKEFDNKIETLETHHAVIQGTRNYNYNTGIYRNLKEEFTMNIGRRLSVLICTCGKRVPVRFELIKYFVQCT